MLSYIKAVSCFIAVGWAISGNAVSFCFAGDLDEKRIIAKINSDLYSCQFNKKHVASHLLELLGNNPSFAVRSIAGSTAPDLWTMLRGTCGGRGVASLITPVYKAGGRHPLLTESQAIIIKAAVFLSEDSAGSPDPAIFTKAAALAGDLCRARAASLGLGSDSLLSLPFLVAAMDWRDPPYADTDERLLALCGLDSDHARILFASRSFTLSESDLVRRLAIENQVYSQADRTKLGNRARSLHAIAFYSAVAFLLDENGDAHTDFSILEAAPTSEYAPLVQLAKVTTRLDKALRIYREQVAVLADTAIPPSVDSMLSDIRDGMRSEIKSLAQESHSLADLLFGIRSVPSELVSLLLPAISFSGF